MKRKIVNIDEDKCNGCGLCIPNCHEGALKIIDGKARLLGDLFCDGLGNCLGHCPQDAITIEEREAEAYDEYKVMEAIAEKGSETIKAHLLHLKDHGENEFFKEGIKYLEEHGIENPLHEKNEGSEKPKMACGCPGSNVKTFKNIMKKADGKETSGSVFSTLEQWPVQLHLLPPTAPFFRNADVLLAADCCAFSTGGFHQDYLSGKSLAIACPKLDTGQDVYVEKLAAMIDESEINTLTVMTMEVPCCGGLLSLAKEACAKANRKIPVKHIMIGVRGEKLKDEWV